MSMIFYLLVALELTGFGWVIPGRRRNLCRRAPHLLLQVNPSISKTGLRQSKKSDRRLAPFANHSRLPVPVLSDHQPALSSSHCSAQYLACSVEASVPLIHLAPRHKLSMEFVDLLDALGRAA